jgi:hypothetical protein
MRKWMALILVMVLVFGLAAPAFADTHRHHPKPVKVSHPYTARQKYKVAQEFKTWGWVTPKVSTLTSETLQVLVYVRTGSRTWEQTKTIDATLSNLRRPKNKTRYATAFSLDAAGRYRMRAKYSWVDAAGVARTKLSSYKYFRIVAPKVHTAHTTH